MSKLRSVIRHEYLTIIRQPSFWISMIAFPLIFAVIFGLSYIGNQSSADRIEELSQNLQDVAVVDESGLISPEVVESFGLKLESETQRDELQSAVQAGDRQALVVYPENLAEEQTYQVYISTPDLSLNQALSTLSDNILKTSLYLPLGDENIITLAQSGAQSQVTTYENGVESAGINEYIVPGLFLALFYVIFLFSISYMLTSVSEEKENRSMEMVLTYVKSRHLIVGKLLAVTLVTLTQLLFFAVLGVTAFLVARSLGNELSLPFGIDISEWVFDPIRIAFGFAFVVVGFLLFAGLMTAVAAAAPSSKEANNFATIFYFAPFVPFYFVMTILTDPENPIVSFMTYFPLTSPVVTLARNALGNMNLAETSLALVVMIGFMLLAVGLAVRIFSRGALEFSQTIKLSTLLKK